MSFQIQTVFGKYLKQCEVVCGGEIKYYEETII